MHPFRELRVWQQGRALAMEIYTATRDFPDHERFGLSSQLRRAAVSVVANIAEGSKRRHKRDFARFLNIAEGSAAEVECLVDLSSELSYFTPERRDELLERTDHVGRMLATLRAKVEKQA